MLSIAQARGSVSFPSFAGERIYMLEFDQASGLPAEVARWQPTVDEMLEGIVAPGPLYLMVDESVVAGGTPQRRPGAHMDGYWHPGSSRHSGGHGPGAHHTRPGHRAVESPSHSSRPGHSALSGRHGPTHRAPGGWASAHLQESWAPEAVLLASSVSACRALVGDWDGPIGEGGDCSGSDLSRLSELVMEAGRVYAGNVTMVHESLPVPVTCERTLVRLNVPGWSPELAA